MKLSKVTLRAAMLFLFVAAITVDGQILFPVDKATMVNPDVQLKLTFKDAPHIGTLGKVRIYDAANGRVVDTLDISIPAGPTKPVDPAVRAKDYLKFPYPYARTSRPTNRDTKPGTGSAGATPTSSSDYQLTIIGGFTDGFHFLSHHDRWQYRDDTSAQRPAGIR